MKSIIKTKTAPEAIGPYAQATVAGQFVFTAGQIGLVPESGQMILGGIGKQTEQALKNLMAVIAAAGADMISVVKTNVYLTRAEDFAPMNEVYANFFNREPPARTTVFVTALPKGALVEIEAIATLH